MSKTRHLASIFSDWHIHDYKRFNDNGSRLSNCIRVLYDIAKFNRGKGIKTILFSGDLYDTQKALLTNVVNETVKAFKTFEFHYPEQTIYAITGNHDQSTKNLLEHPAISALSHIEAICSNFVVIDNKHYEIEDNIILHGIPYYEYKEHFNTKLQSRGEDAMCIKATCEEDNLSQPKQILLIHQTPDGLGNDMIPTDTNPKDKGYDQFDHVFCGHIHIHKRITDKFTLVGNPIHRDLADAGHPKGFLVMNLLAPENGLKFIQLKGYPEFIRAFEDEEVEEEGNYVVRHPRPELVALSETANVSEFNTNLESGEILENYWKEVDGKDEELLEIGLSFLPTSHADKSN